ncbi:MAG: LamB/YcsF family protein [Opitutus sp.]|nr:LamB/YcsF family protein [Opitutus sp.]
MTIDLNCDLGEGAGHDAELMPLISSANIACGAHAGDAATMRATVALAVRHGVAIGAHPGFADRENFGRRELAVSPAAAAELVLTQVQALQEISAESGAVVSHVKLHGALYNLASRDAALAEAIVRAIGGTRKIRILYVLAGSEFERVARTHGNFRVVAEFFSDRTYQRDGSLTSRREPNAMITDEDAAVAQVLTMVRKGVVCATDGTEIPVTAGTVCLHGDGSNAVAFARRLRRSLAAAGIAVRAPVA